MVISLALSLDGKVVVPLRALPVIVPLPVLGELARTMTDRDASELDHPTVYEVGPNRRLRPANPERWRPGLLQMLAAGPRTFIASDPPEIARVIEWYERTMRPLPPELYVEQFELEYHTGELLDTALELPTQLSILLAESPYLHPVGKRRRRGRPRAQRPYCKQVEWVRAVVRAYEQASGVLLLNGPLPGTFAAFEKAVIRIEYEVINDNLLFNCTAKTHLRWITAAGLSFAKGRPGTAADNFWERHRATALTLLKPFFLTHLRKNNRTKSG